MIFFNYLVRKSFQNDEEWRLFYCDSTLGCRVIQDFDLCKLDMCDVKRYTKWCEISKKLKIEERRTGIARSRVQTPLKS